MSTYSVYSDSDGLIASRLSYSEARAIYNRECEAAKYDFVDEINDGITEPEQYRVVIFKDVATSMPVEIDAPDGEPKTDEDGTHIIYYDWHGETAPAEEDAE